MRLGRIGSPAQVGGQGHAWQEWAVFTGAAGFAQVLLERAPERHVAAVAPQQEPEGGAPAAVADDAGVRPGHRAFSRPKWKRFSVPFQSRCRLARWRAMTSAARSVSTAGSGRGGQPRRRGPSRARRPLGAAIEASEDIAAGRENEGPQTSRAPGPRAAQPEREPCAGGHPCPAEAEEQREGVSRQRSGAAEQLQPEVRGGGRRAQARCERCGGEVQHAGGGQTFAEVEGEGQEAGPPAERAVDVRGADVAAAEAADGDPRARAIRKPNGTGER